MAAPAYNLKQAIERITGGTSKEDLSMKVALTGATGFIGSHVLAALQGHGHEVTALVRDDAQAEAVAARGATPAVVDLYDTPAVVSLFSDAEGAIHTASPGDETSAGLDSAAVDAAIEAFDGTGNGSTGTTRRSPTTRPSTRPRWSRGGSRSRGGCSRRRACAES
jgi:NAD(P)-dependent dehydrogenase (short-subunit alcohol dehydrogenase family)